MSDRTVKETIHEEGKKLRELSFKQKLVYIWDYYKPVMVGIILVIVLICICVETYKNKQIEMELSVLIANGNTYEEEAVKLHDDFVAYSGLNNKNQEVSFDTTYTFSLDEQDEVALDSITSSSQMKLMAVVAAQSLDVMVMPEGVYRNFLNMGAYQDLAEVLDSASVEEYSELLQWDRQEEDSEAKAYALKLTGNAKLQEMFGDQTVYVTIVANSVKKENAVTFIKYLLS